MLSAFHTNLTAAQLRAGGHALGIEDVLRARRIIAGRVRPTATATHPLLSQRLGCCVHVKLENSQALGSFKLRGWMSLLAQMTPDEARRGIVAAPSIAHQRPLAAAAGISGVACTQIVAAGATAALAELSGGEFVLDGSDPLTRTRNARRLAERSGARWVDPAEERDYIAGAGTVGLELIEQVGRPLDAVFVPVGSGSLAAGMTIALKTLSPHTRVIGVRSDTPGSSVAGWLAAAASETTRAVLDDLLDECIEVSEAELHDAIRCYAETLRQTADGAGAAALAGARRLRRQFSDQRVGVVLSGGNIEAATLREVLRGSPTGEAQGPLRQRVDEMYL